MYLKTDSMGRSEICDGEPEESAWTPDWERAENQNLIWTGPYQPGGKDATDVVSPSWPEGERAMARLQAFSPEEKAARKAWRASPAGRKR